MSQSEGYLQIRASAADRAIPVSGARVEVMSSDDMSSLAVSQTDADGQSEVFPLSAPPVENSESPDEPRAYTPYIVQVSHPNYVSVQVNEVAVFPGIMSTLPVSLTPVSDGSPNITTIVGGQTGPNGSGTAN